MIYHCFTPLTGAVQHICNFHNVKGEALHYGSREHAMRTTFNFILLQQLLRALHYANVEFKGLKQKNDYK